MPPNEKYDELEIVEQTNYLNVILLPAIRDIDEAIKSGKDGMDCAENLLTDIIWIDEIREKVEGLRAEYNQVLEEQNSFLRKGTLESQKIAAMRKIEVAKKEYSKSIKHTIILLIHEKIGLFKTRKAIDHGFKTYKELGVKEDDDDD